MVKEILNLARHETKKAQIKQIDKKIREGMLNVPVDKKIKKENEGKGFQKLELSKPIRILEHLEKREQNRRGKT